MLYGPGLGTANEGSTRPPITTPQSFRHDLGAPCIPVYNSTHGPEPITETAENNIVYYFFRSLHRVTDGT